MMIIIIIIMIATLLITLMITTAIMIMTRWRWRWRFRWRREAMMVMIKNYNAHNRNTTSSGNIEHRFLDTSMQLWQNKTLICKEPVDMASNIFSLTRRELSSVCKYFIVSIWLSLWSLHLLIIRHAIISGTGRTDQPISKHVRNKVMSHGELGGKRHTVYWSCYIWARVEFCKINHLPQTTPHEM